MTERSQRFWLWVSSPEYTQEGTLLRKDGWWLAPGRTFPGDNDGDEYFGWTCHPETRDGDLVLVYRSSQNTDGERLPAEYKGFSNIRWLLKAHGNPYSLRRYEEASRRGWTIGIDYEVLAAFQKPLHIRRLKKTEPLSAWGPIKANLQGRTGSWSVELPFWKALTLLLVESNPETRQVFRGHMQVVPDWL